MAKYRVAGREPITVDLTNVQRTTGCPVCERSGGHAYGCPYSKSLGASAREFDEALRDLNLVVASAATRIRDWMTAHLHG